VLADAVARLPDEHRAAAGAELVQALRNRRDELPGVARAFYELLAREVDVTGTDQDEVAQLTWEDAGTLTLTVAAGGAAPAFRRSFHATETREVRLELRGGADRARVEGAGGPIHVRVVGGGGEDVLEDATTAGRVGLYDEDGNTRFVAGPRTRIDRRSWDAPLELASSSHQSKARDWGGRWIPIPDIGFEPDVGLHLGVGVQYTGYGFRHFPYRSRLELKAGLGTSTGRPRASVYADLPLVRERLRADIGLVYEGAEVPRFHGLGNETAADQPRSFYELEGETMGATVGVRVLPRRGATLRLDASLLAIRPELGTATLANQLAPYGHADFERLALGGALAWATTDEASDAPSLGAGIELSGFVAPALLDVSAAYRGASFAARARAALPGPLRPVLIARAGGQRLFGRYPIFDAAALGGRGSLHGYRSRRFTGDAALFAGAEARVFLSEYVFLLPGDIGILGLADVGRVFLEGESSRTWHAGWGAGLWTSFIDAFDMSVTWARGSEGAVWYVTAGSPF
jgi:hypothetical protein